MYKHYAGFVGNVGSRTASTTRQLNKIIIIIIIIIYVTHTQVARRAVIPGRTCFQDQEIYDPQAILERHTGPPREVFASTERRVGPPPGISTLLRYMFAITE